MTSKQQLLERFQLKQFKIVYFSLKLYITLLRKYLFKNHGFQLTQSVTRTDGMTRAILAHHISFCENYDKSFLLRFSKKCSARNIKVKNPLGSFTSEES